MYCNVAGKVIPKPLEGLEDFLRPSGTAYRSNMGVKLIVTEISQPSALQHAHLCDWDNIIKKGKDIGKEVLFYIGNSK